MLALLAPAAFAAASEPLTLESCARVAEDGPRLACYDALAHRAPSAPAPSPPPPVAPAPAAQAPAAAPPPAAMEQRFGAESLSQPPPGAEAPKDVSKIESHLVGPFKGWKPGTEFALSNGQVWKCTADDNAYYPDIPDDPAVVIRRGFFTGSYYMEVAGTERKVKVRRIR